MRLGDTKFLNLFALLAVASCPDRECCAWRVEGVEWRRERMAHKGPDFIAQIETHILTRAGLNGWALLIGHETWWDGRKHDAFRNGKWVHVVNGNRATILKWFAERERDLEATKPARKYAAR